MNATQLRNGDFEADWSEEKSHRYLVVPEGSEPYLTTGGRVMTPPGWLTWFRNVPGVWDQPGVRDARLASDARRVRSGLKAISMTASYRKFDAGLLQRVEVGPGLVVRLTAWAHAWSNGDVPGGHPDDAEWSDGVGYRAVAFPAGGLAADTGEPQEDAKPNVTLQVGVDPTGGTNPLARTVVWGEGWHIYNGYCKEITVETATQAATITVFLRGTTLQPSRHNEVYWDDATLEVIGEAPVLEESPKSGLPVAVEPVVVREAATPREYERVYVLFPPDATAEEAHAILDEHFDEHPTFGFNADDAGLDHPNVVKRTVIAYWPQAWPMDLGEFFGTYYPGIDNYIPIEKPALPTLRPSRDLLLWQCDPKWKGRRFGRGGCGLTICQAGCYITCLAMAQRYYRIDPKATPVTVDEGLGAAGYLASGPCLALWAGAEKKLGVRIRGGKTEAAHAHLDSGRVCMAEVSPTSLQHFVLVLRREDRRYWMLDPWKNVEGWLDERYRGVDSWRLLYSVKEEETAETRDPVDPEAAQ